MGISRYFPLGFMAIVFALLPYSYTARIEGFIKIDFYAIWLIGCLCWLWAALLSPIKCSRASVFLVLAVTYVVFLAFIQSPFDDNSLYFLITFICLVGIIYYLRIVFSRKKGFWLITGLLFVSYVFQVFTGFSQAIANHWAPLSIQGQFSNSGFFANYLVGFLPIGFSMILKQKLRNFVRVGLITILLLGFILICCTKARSALIGFLSAGCVVIILAMQRPRKMLVTISLCILFLPFIGYLLYLLKPNSAQGRLTIYRVSFNIIKDHPVIGIGPNRFSAVYNNYQAEYLEKNKLSISQQLLADNSFEAFNFILQLLAEYGIIGFFLLLLLILTFFKKFKTCRRHSPYVTGSLASLIALLVSALFSNPFHLTPILPLLCYHVSVVYPMTCNTFQNKLLQKPTIPIVSVSIFSFFVALYSFKQYTGAVNWSKAAQTAVFNDFNKAETIYRRAYSSLRHNGDFLFNYGAEAYIGNRYGRAIQVLERAKRFYSSSNLYVYLGNAYSAMNQFDEAERNYLTAIYIAPSHIYPKYQLIQLYKKWQRTNDMRFWRDKAISFPTKIKSDFADKLKRELSNMN
jgi:O-antigen ligase